MASDIALPVLAVESVHVYYGNSHILHGVSLAVGPGEIVCLLGRNGAGKSTTVRSIIGFTPPRRGVVLFEGQPIHQRQPDEIARLGIGLVPQGRRIFGDLTALENLRIAVRRREGDWPLERVFALFPFLRERAQQRGATLSGGEQQMLAIARALLGNPKLMLMDEPSEGLAPVVLREVREVILRLKAQRLSILLVEQNLGLALSVADRVYIMNKGEIVFHGTPERLEGDPSTRSRYLGAGGEAARG